MKKIWLLVTLLFLPVKGVYAEINEEMVTLTELNEIKENEEALNSVVTVTVLEDDDINNLYLIDYCPNVQDITIDKQEINDISVINNLTSTSNLNVAFSDVYVDLKGLHNDYITEVYFSMSHVKNFEAIINLSNLEYLSVDSTEGYKDIAYSKLAKFRGLSLIAQSIDDYDKFTNELFNITSLSLENSNLKNEDTKYITKMKNLELLNIKATYVDDISFLENLPNLKDVTLPLGLEKDALDILDHLPKLEVVNWDGYTELQVSRELLSYLDSKNIYYPKYYPEIGNRVEEIITELSLSNNASVEEKVYAVTKYIAQNMYYSEEYVEDYATSLDQFVLRGYGVCHNYAVLTYTLLKRLGVDVYYVSGPVYTSEADKYSFGAHAWNSVKIANDWFGIDNTWVGSVTGEYLEENIKEYVLKNIGEDSPFYDKRFEVQHISYNQPKDVFKISNSNNLEEDEEGKENLAVDKGNINDREFKILGLVVLMIILCLVRIGFKKRNKVKAKVLR